MAVNRVEIKDFLVFKGEFKADFCAGVNVLIGGNGTGKTTLLRAIAIQPILSYPYLLGQSTASENTPDLRKIGNAVEVFPFPDGKYNKDRHVFIPVNEMLSHPEIYPMSQKYNLPYNNTEVEIIENAMLPATKEFTPNAATVLDVLSKEIGGEVVFENNQFYICKANGEKLPFSLEASGFQKLGLLWKLIRNGLLESESVLFWDEPENSLNPEIVPILVDVLLQLSRNGVQIFIATHSELLAEYFAVLREKSKGDEVKFFSLYKDGEQIKYDAGDRFDLLTPNDLMTEPVKLYEKQLVRGLSGNG
jgi:AAA15 family ATPase/GTPase